MVGLDALDLRTRKPNGESWNFERASDPAEALQLAKDLKPRWLIGSPPCTAISQLQTLFIFKKMDPDKAKNARARSPTSTLRRIFIPAADLPRETLLTRASSAGVQLERPTDATYP